MKHSINKLRYKSTNHKINTNLQMKKNHNHNFSIPIFKNVMISE